jgi:hypothetical protein
MNLENSIIQEGNYKTIEGNLFVTGNISDVYSKEQFDNQFTVLEAELQTQVDAAVAQANAATAAAEAALTTYRKGEIIEVLTSICDGSSVEVESGTYVFPTATTLQLSTSYQDIPGSTITYTPPTGTRQVIYEYEHQLSWTDAHAISHWKLYIGGSEVTGARTSLSGYYPERREHHTWVFNIGGSTSTATGRQSTWTTGKELKWRARDYGTSNENDRVNYTTYWDGTSGTEFSYPIIKITALA